MNTPSHFLMTTALTKVKRLKVVKSAALLGSVAPDIPLYCLCFGTFFWLRYVEQWEPRRIFQTMFDTLFYQDPVWIALHNFLHAPLILLAGLLFVCFSKKSIQKIQSSWLFWFLSSCLLHTVVDIFTHNDDGPLIWFPFDWKTRYASPVSYWDSDHFGREFSLFEFWFDVALILFLVTSWIFSMKSQPTPSGSCS